MSSDGDRSFPPTPVPPVEAVPGPQRGDVATGELDCSDFAALLDAATFCVLVHDATTKRILWANPAACALLEFSLEEIKTLTASDMSSAAQQFDRAIGRAWLHEAVEKGSSRYEWHYRSKSGRVIRTDALAKRVDLSDRVVVMVQFRDIEREREVELKLRRTTTYVDALARHTSTLAMMVSRDGELLFATDTLTHRLGITEEDPPDAWLDHVRLRHNGKVVGWDAVVVTSLVTGLQLQVIGPNGVEAWLEGSMERLRDQDDTALVLLHDATDRIEFENRRSRALQQENYLARYNAMGDMAMAIAHELGQPMAAASNFLTGVATRLDNLTRTRRIAVRTANDLNYGLEAAGRQIERASAIVSAVRSFVGHLEAVERVVDLHEVLEECLWFIRLRADQADVSLVLNLADDPVEVRCEQVLTGQVLLNLAFNAIDEMAQCPKGSRRVTITVRRASAEWAGTEGRGDVGVLTVEDEGRGLDRDPFEKSFTSKKHGSGIGLALSHRIITRQHGRIWGDNRPDGGSQFGFALPLAEQKSAPEAG